MKLSHFSFELPDELLAEYPSENRDEARLMVLNREKQTIEHKHFKDLIDYFEEEDVMILNNTKVFPARLFGNKEKPVRVLKYSCFANSIQNNVFGMCW